jgi:hypothetical protein
MQNKANWKMTQMFVTKALTTDYNSWTLSIRGKNKAKTKPIYRNENAVQERVSGI